MATLIWIKNPCQQQQGKGGGGYSAPAAPDPYATAQAQALANKEAVWASADANRVVQNNPQGSMAWKNSLGDVQERGGTYGVNGKTFDTQDLANNYLNGLGVTQSGKNYVFNGANYTSADLANGARSALLDKGVSRTGSSYYVGDRSFTTLDDAKKYQNTMGKWVQDVTYSPEQQKLYDLTNQASQKYGETANAQLDLVRDKLSVPLDYSSLGAAPTVNEATRQSVADSMYQRLNPQLDRDRAALETSLANQGITSGSAAYNTAMDEINRSKTDARLAIDSQAGNEMARMYGLESSARTSAINEMVQQRSTPLNELSAMLSGAQVQGLQFAPVQQYQVAAPDIMGMTSNNYAIGSQNAATSAGLKNSSSNANTSGMYGLLGAGMTAAAMF